MQDDERPGRRFGVALRQLRERAGYTHAQLAERAGLSRSYISRLEAGDYDRPAYDTLYHLARAFGLSGADALMAQLGLLPAVLGPSDLGTLSWSEAELLRTLGQVPEPLRQHAAETAIGVLRGFVRIMRPEAHFRRPRDLFTLSA